MGPAREAGTDWAHRFDDDARAAATRRRPDGGARPCATTRLRLAVPTPDHFLPLLCLAGPRRAAGEPLRHLVDGRHAMGPLGMTSYTLGLQPAGGDAVRPQGGAGAEGRCNRGLKGTDILVRYRVASRPTRFRSGSG